MKYPYLGRVTPRVIAVNKYKHNITLGLPGVRDLGVDGQFRDTAVRLLGAAGSFNTIKVHRAAMNKINSIEEKYGVDLELPWDSRKLANFALSCVTDDLKASTIKNYVSQIKKGHMLSNLPWNPDMALFNSLMKGRENTTDPELRRIAVTPRMLVSFWKKLLEMKAKWTRHDRRALWAVICFMWSGSFRSAEILCPSSSGFVEEESFCWNKLGDMKNTLEGSEVRWYAVHLVRPKEARAGKGAVKVELFDVDSIWNPVTAMDKYRRDNVHGEVAGLPVFRWSSGANITRRELNSFIKDCSISLEGYPVGASLSSHSFRAGIVSLMGAMGCEESLIKSVGRWSGDSWIRYAKAGRSIRLGDQRRIQMEAATNFLDWAPIPVMVEETGN